MDLRKPKLISVEAAKRYVGKRDLVINAYAPWCTHCQKFEATYTEFYQRLKMTHPNVKVVRLNAHKHLEELEKLKIGADKYESSISEAIQSYPTVLLLRQDGQGGVYEGQREVGNMTDLIGKFFS
jgi:thiol-disulfide isomerase/thioredoxin